MNSREFIARFSRFPSEFFVLSVNREYERIECPSCSGVGVTKNIKTEQEGVCGKCDGNKRILGQRYKNNCTATRIQFCGFGFFGDVDDGYIFSRFDHFPDDHSDCCATSIKDLEIFLTETEASERACELNSKDVWH